MNILGWIIFRCLSISLKNTNCNLFFPLSLYRLLTIAGGSFSDAVAAAERVSLIFG